MTDIKECPYCGKDIKAGAIKCKHCHAMLNKSFEEATLEKQQTKKPNKNKPNPIMYTIIAISVVLFAIVAIYYINFYNKAADIDHRSFSDVAADTQAETTITFFDDEIQKAEERINSLLDEINIYLEKDSLTEDEREHLDSLFDEYELLLGQIKAYEFVKERYISEN